MVITRTLLKYGYFNFSLEILEYSDLNILRPREKDYIDTLKPEYNIALIPGSSSLGTHTKEVRQKISKSRKGINKFFHGKRHNETALTIIRIAALNRLKPPDISLKLVTW